MSGRDAGRRGTDHEDRAVEVGAPAKINLFLEVGGRRPDGFHEVSTLFQMVDLSDEVRVARVREAGIGLEVEGAELGPAEENLAWRAAEAFLRRHPIEGGVRIRLRKRIPAGGGLGGGSSDAAAVLRCLAALCSVESEVAWIREEADALGSDVPFFLSPTPLAHGAGRGTMLTSFPPLPPHPLVLGLPPVHVSTAQAYRLLSAARAGRGRAAGGERSRSEEGPRSWEEVFARMGNDFQEVVGGCHPEIARSLEVLERAGAIRTLLSGSGGASFGFFRDEPEAVEVAEVLTREVGWPFRAGVTRGEVPSVRGASSVPQERAYDDHGRLGGHRR